MRFVRCLSFLLLASVGVSTVGAPACIESYAASTEVKASLSVDRSLIDDIGSPNREGFDTALEDPIKLAYNDLKINQLSLAFRCNPDDVAEIIVPSARAVSAVITGWDITLSGMQACSKNQVETLRIVMKNGTEYPVEIIYDGVNTDHNIVGGSYDATWDGTSTELVWEMPHVTVSSLGRIPYLTYDTTLFVDGVETPYLNLSISDTSISQLRISADILKDVGVGLHRFQVINSCGESIFLNVTIPDIESFNPVNPENPSNPGGTKPGDKPSTDGDDKPEKPENPGETNPGGTTNPSNPEIPVKPSKPSTGGSGSGGSSNSGSRKPVTPASTPSFKNPDGSYNTGYRPSVPNNGGSWSLDEDGNWIYTLPDGQVPLEQWIADGKGWYRFDAQGRLVFNWFLDGDGKWYMLDKREETLGRMWYGWYYEEMDRKWYFFDLSDGHMLTDWQFIDGKWYYFTVTNGGQTYFGDNVNGWHFDPINKTKPYGSMYSNEVTPDGHFVKESGERQ